MAQMHYLQRGCCLFTCLPLKRQRNQVAKATIWKCVLARKHPVIGIQLQFSLPFHCRRQQGTALLSGRCTRYRILKEYPQVAPSPHQERSTAQGISHSSHTLRTADTFSCHAPSSKSTARKQQVSSGKIR